MTNRRPSLPRGLAWPVSTVDVRRSLGDAFGLIELHWFGAPTGHGPWVTLMWDPTGQPRWMSEPGPDLALGPVPDELEAQARDLLLGEVLPEVALRVLSWTFLDADWQRLRHSVWWSLDGGALRRQDHDESTRKPRRR